MKTDFDGGCLCGKTRYRVTAVPTGLGDCHCIDCRRGSAAAFVTWGTVARANVALTRGAVRVVAHAGRQRSFAACCGTPLFFTEAEDAATVDFTICSLDDPAPFAPKKAIWTEDRLPWVVLNDTLPAHQQGGGAA